MNDPRRCKKVPYSNEREALNSYKYMDLTQDGVTECNAYLCSTCKVYHLTSSKVVVNTNKSIRRKAFNKKVRKLKWHKKIKRELREIRSLINEQSYRDRLKLKSRLLVKLMKIEYELQVNHGYKKAL